MILPIIAMLLLAPIFVLAQQNVGIGTTTPNANAILDLSSSNKGLLIPRLSNQYHRCFTLSALCSRYGGLQYGYGRGCYARLLWL